MTSRFLNLAFTPSVKTAQYSNGSRKAYASRDGATEPDILGEDEMHFIATRDSFYMASVGATGWPYVQHRGGPVGFVKILSLRQIGIADFRGNKQYISVGNLADDSRVALFFMDYTRRTRLKLLGRAKLVDLANASELAATLAIPDYKAKVERGLIIDVEAFDWNCSQHITPRFTLADIGPSVEALKSRISELEQEVKQLKGR